MAQYDGSIRINTQINTDGLKKGEADIKGSMGRVATAAKKFAAVIGAAFAVGKIVQFGKECLDLGSDLQEVQNVVDVTFTTMSKKVNEFAKNAAVSAGLSETMAKRYVGTFGAMAKSFGFAEEDAYNMSTALAQLSGDVASFYNISQDESYTKLKSVFTGETETLKDLGVVMTQSALDAYAMANGFGKTTSAMTEQEKVALRLRFVQDQLSAASEDFIRTSDSWANQTRILKLQIDSLKATIGQGLINLFTPIIKIINILLGKLATLANDFKSFTELVTGKKASEGAGTATGIEESANGYSDAADAADNLANATENVADATKDAEKAAEGYLSPLDEINKFSKKEELPGLEDMEIGGISGIENVDYGKVAEGKNVLDKVNESANGLTNKLKELAGIFKQGFFDGLGDWEYRWESIKDSIASIKDSLIDIFIDPAVLAAADGWAKSVSYLLGSIAGSAANIGLTIATNLFGGIEKYFAENKDRIKNYLVSMFYIRSEINQMFAELFRSISCVFEAFASENGQQLTANIIGIFTDAFMGITELASKLFRDIAQIIIRPFTDNEEAFRIALEGFLGVLAEVAETIKESIDKTFDELNKVYDEHLKPFFDSVATGLSDTAGKFLDFWNKDVQPVLDRLVEKFDTVWKEHIQPVFDKFAKYVGKVADMWKAVWENLLKPFIDWIIKNILPVILPIYEGITKGAMEVFGIIGDVAGNIIDAVGGIVDFLTGVFTGDWEKAWNGIVDVFRSVLNLIPSIAEGIINKAIDAINGIIGGINTITVKIPGEVIPQIPEIQNISIPRLATGAVIPANKEFLAVLGDQKRGTNVEAPLDTIKQAQRESLIEVLSELGLIGGAGSSNPQTIIIKQYLDGKQIAESVVKEGKVQQMASGKNMFLLGTT